MKTIFGIVVCIVALLRTVEADTTVTPTVSFGSASTTVSQASGEARITVKVDGPPLVDVFGTNVYMKSVDGTATWPDDYDALNHSLKFNTAERSKTLVVGIPTAPEFEGTRTFSIRFNTGSDYDIGTPSTITVNIVGSIAPEISVETPTGVEIADAAAMIDFGETSINGSTSREVTVRNNGGGNLTGLLVSQVNPTGSPFKLIQPSSSAIPPGGSASFSIVFNPSAVGEFKGEILVSSNDLDESPFNIAVTGTGITSPEIGVEYPEGVQLKDNASSLSCGSVVIGAPGTSRTIFIRSIGSEALSGLGASMGGANAGDFAIESIEANSLEPGEDLQLDVTFNPTDSGARSAVLLISSNDSDENPFEIMLTGSASHPAPEIVVEQPTGSSLKDGVSKSAFGTAKVGKRGLTKTFSIRNTGTANLSGLAITKDGPSSRDFIVTPLAKTFLPPGTAAGFKITFQPKAKGNRIAALHIRSNDSNENPFDVKLSGFGVGDQ